MIQVQTRDDPNSEGIILELSGHADPLPGDDPEKGVRICAGVSMFMFPLAVFCANQNKTSMPDPLWSGFLHLCLQPEQFHLMPFILTFFYMKQGAYPGYVKFTKADTRTQDIQ